MVHPLPHLSGDKIKIRTSLKTLCALTVAALAASPVLAFTASNYMRVNPVNTSVFEVVARGGARPGDYWCAAAEYLLYKGSTNATQRIYLVRELGAAETANRRSAAQFSLQAPSGVDTNPGVTMSVQRVGENLSAAMARDQCYDRDWRWKP